MLVPELIPFLGHLNINVRRASSAVRRAVSTIALIAYSSYIPGPIDSILGRKHRGDL